MADRMSSSDGMIFAAEDIASMKVTDLKKKLKELGLPLSGNKTELVERLQEAYTSNKGTESFDSSHLSFDESQVSELDTVEGSALLDTYIESPETDSKVLEFSANELTSVSKPPMKRNLAKAAVENTGTKKKVLLNRTNVSNSQFNITPVVLAQSENPTETKNEVKKVSTVNTMTPAERLAMRAKRFNTSNTVVTSSNKLTNFGKPIILSATGVAPNLELLKKRAERFGQSVSTVMKQIEEKEKILKRKCKFGASLSASTSSNLDETARKKRRAERFGVS